MRFYTPLRYPGGKGKLSYYIKAIIEENRLHDGHYIEPYAGGAGVAIELLMLEYVRTIHINDIDPAVYGFWHSVLNNTDELCQRISDTTVNMETWFAQKDVLKNTDKHSLLEIGFATFFLNRTNRSGILNAGVIGGKAQAGKWKMDVRYNKKNLIDRIQDIAEYDSRIAIYNVDATQFVQDIPDSIHSKALVYLDPPYYNKGQGLYRNYYEHDDHVEVMKALKDSDIANWIVTYDNTLEIKEIYDQFRMIEYDLQYTAQQKKVGGEVMIYSDKITLPGIPIGKQEIKLSA
ncbi:DNA adenine methylase [Desulfoluna spongiiphila]|uniref:DNA adenine methylase n=1 Tax=Desulfoluna spongiiphila TaxID=419481 RepID=UPI001254A66A|nr:DNA adenine methylase [Desulfoluna spongiiphila]VVS91040.1 adenine modification methylase m.ecorv-type [Desulfoluna spongiiphila]